MNKKKFALTAEQIERAAAIYHQWQSEGTDGNNFAEPELYRSVNISEIGNEENAYSLVPSRYIEFVDRDSNMQYDEVLTAASINVADLLKRHTDNVEKIRNAFNGLGYECE